MKFIELAGKLYGPAAWLCKRLLAWCKKSPWNLGSFTLGLTLVLYTAFIGRYEYDQYLSRHAFDVRTSELKRGLENRDLKAAADAIEACLRSSTGARIRPTSVCELAESLFLEAFRDVDSPVVAKYLASHDYELMALHIGRVLETNRVVERYSAQEAAQPLLQRYPFTIIGFLLEFTVVVTIPLAWLYAASRSEPARTTPRRLTRSQVLKRSQNRTI